MRAYVLNEFSKRAHFEQIEIEKPVVLPGYVLIRVAATSINPIDGKIRSGAVPIGPSIPAILHGDVAGVVVDIGEGVTGFSIGDEVYGYAGGVKGRQGALADYMVAEATLIAHKPKTLSFQEASALPVVAITAWKALIERANIQQGQKVLIHGATGGVGHIAIQLAKYKGAIVYATASSEEKVKIGYELGADHVFSYREKHVDEYVEEYTDGKGFDVVLDTVGTQTLDDSLQAAKVNGTVMSIATRSTHDLSMMHAKGLTLHVVFSIIPLLHHEGKEEQQRILQLLAEVIDNTGMKPLLDPLSFSFGDANKAYEYMENEKKYGKVILYNESFSGA
ncbi:zinc-dependent alcohol dehydrogenase family protein [Priestia taiwanensis]|uniref:Quinone oxidoreductase n=1 Tax=Priestia taiwanensis TaxID=1347902 RepID=A0A917AUU3_9BACI|nr:zinc-dependent alcohol dehydrogenase family protein [Priestia taiwanensis]MBM7363713.1 NADPH2:quinone reductase [Priestia taiwanensis]GGE74736.1 quinone oxidoreductase [Priestia taiwanensis]